MSHHHLPAITYVLVAPLATAMLAVDLRRRVASVEGPDIAQDEHPIGYWLATAFNMALVFLSWLGALNVVPKLWAGG